MAQLVASEAVAMRMRIAEVAGNEEKGVAAEEEEIVERGEEIISNIITRIRIIKIIIINVVEIIMEVVVVAVVDIISNNSATMHTTITEMATTETAAAIKIAI